MKAIALKAIAAASMCAVPCGFVVGNLTPPIWTKAAVHHSKPTPHRKPAAEAAKKPVDCVSDKYSDLPPLNPFVDIVPPASGSWVSPSSGETGGDIPKPPITIPADEAPTWAMIAGFGIAVFGAHLFGRGLKL